MKTNLIAMTFAVLATAIPIQLSAQHTRFRLVDFGTPGGPQAYLNIPEISHARILNDRGAVAGWADTSTSDPFGSFCFTPDCFVSLVFQGRKDVRIDLPGLADGLSSAASWISPNGLIAGVSQNGQVDPSFPGFPENHAVLWKHGNILDLGTLPEGGYESFASAVNSRGEVAGWALNTVADPNSMACPGFCPTQTRAFLWDGHEMQDLGTLGGPDAMALLINERGQVVGDSYTSSNPSDYCANNIGFPLTTGVFLWENDNIRDLGNLGGTCAVAFALNNRGQVIGVSTLAGDQAQHPFLSDGGTMKDLGTFGGNVGSALAISDTGKIVGWATYPGGSPFHAAVWSAGGITDLGTLPGDVNSFAFDVNARGQIVGASTDSQFATVRAVLWEKDGTMLNLETLLTDAGLQLGFGVGNINDRGEIAGSALDVNNNSHAILLVPCEGSERGCEEVGTDSRASTSSISAAAIQHRSATRGMSLAQPSMPQGMRNRVVPEQIKQNTSETQTDWLRPHRPDDPAQFEKGTANYCVPRGGQCYRYRPCCSGLKCQLLGNRGFCESY